jgi:exopolysaccharide production protein ExoZ
MLAGARRTNYIDALRGYAILVVLLVHTLVLTRDVSPVLWSQVGRGGYGVQLFFVISALTLTQSWHERGDGAWAFYVRRVFRIAPMFWLAIIPFHYLPWPWGGIWNHENATAAHILLTAAFAHGVHPLTFNEVVPGGWSIAVESMFYLVFPMLMAVATSLRRALVILVVSLASSWASTRLALILFADSGAAGPALEYYATRWLPAQLPVFMCGVFAYYFVTTDWVRNESWGAETILFLGFAILFGVLPFVQVPMTSICSIYAAVFAAIAVGLARGAGQWLVNSPICWLGKISFSAYLWHFAALSVAAPIILSFPGTLPYLGAVLVILVITVVASTVTYLMIEKPMIRFGSRLASNLKRRRARTTPYVSTAEASAIGGASVAKERS